MAANEPAPRVLIADDQRDVREALRLLLKGEGFVVELASSPAGALEAATRAPFDAMLIDLNYTRDTTSGAEGLDLLEQLLRHDGRLVALKILHPHLRADPVVCQRFRREVALDDLHVEHVVLQQQVVRAARQVRPLGSHLRFVAQPPVVSAPLPDLLAPHRHRPVAGGVGPGLELLSPRARAGWRRRGAGRRRQRHEGRDHWHRLGRRLHDSCE